MSHTASQTWVSKKTKEREAWGRVRNMMVYVAPKSPFTPRTFRGWIAHRLAWMEEERGRIVSQAITRRANENGWSEQAPVGPVLGGKKLLDGLALVLARETIWVRRRGYPSVRNLAPWPSYEELKHEGDDRSKSGYSRFPPLPRGRGNETVNWKQRAPVKQRRFDEVGRPVMECSVGRAGLVKTATALHRGNGQWKASNIRRQEEETKSLLRGQNIFPDLTNIPH